METETRPLPGGWWYVGALCIPLLGVILGLVALARNQVGPGFALWACSFVGLIFSLAYFTYNI